MNDLRTPATIAAESLGHVKRVMFELHNRCHLATVHAKCPLHARRGEDPVILPTKTIGEVVAYLAINGWSGRLSFHNYNDPMIDPRLFYLMKDVVRPHLPDATIFLMTNGWLIDQTMLNELSGMVDSLEVSAYSPAEGKRLNALRVPSGMLMTIKQKADLDERLGLYEQDLSGRRRQRHCNAPLCELVIHSNGDLGLCCFDWRRSMIFGNVCQERLDAILGRGDMLEEFRKLSIGQRTLPICQNCWVTRE